MALTDRQMASEDLRGGLWATRRNPTAQFSTLFWNRIMADKGLEPFAENMSAGYRSALKVATRKAGQPIFRQVERTMPIEQLNLQQLRWNLDRVMGQRPGKELKTPLDIVKCLSQALDFMCEIVDRLANGEELPVSAEPYETPAAPPIKPAKLPARIKRELAQLEAEGKLLHQQAWFKADNGKAKPQSAKAVPHALTATDPHSARSCVKPTAYLLKPGADSFNRTTTFPIWR